MAQKEWAANDQEQLKNERKWWAQTEETMQYY